MPSRNKGLPTQLDLCGLQQIISLKLSQNDKRVYQWRPKWKYQNVRFKNDFHSGIEFHAPSPLLPFYLVFMALLHIQTQKELKVKNTRVTLHISVARLEIAHLQQSGNLIGQFGHRPNISYPLKSKLLKILHPLICSGTFSYPLIFP